MKMLPCLCIPEVKGCLVSIWDPPLVFHSKAFLFTSLLAPSFGFSISFQFDHVSSF
jgi:hypothetical protein